MHSKLEPSLHPTRKTCRDVNRVPTFSMLETSHALKIPPSSYGAKNARWSLGINPNSTPVAAQRIAVSRKGESTASMRRRTGRGR